ncbi:hypothetical protein RFI_06737, partial [Reticulomyxa filosa]
FVHIGTTVLWRRQKCVVKAPLAPIVASTGEIIPLMPKTMEEIEELAQLVMSGSVAVEEYCITTPTEVRIVPASSVQLLSTSLDNKVDKYKTGQAFEPQRQEHKKNDTSEGVSFKKKLCEVKTFISFYFYLRIMDCIFLGGESHTIQFAKQSRKKKKK